MNLNDCITEFRTRGYVFRRGQHLCEFLHYFQIWKNGKVVATLSYDSESSYIPYPMWVAAPHHGIGLGELLWAILARTVLCHENQRIWTDDPLDGWHPRWSDKNPGALWTTPLSMFSTSMISLSLH